jgi:hypothetical protein
LLLPKALRRYRMDDTLPGPPAHTIRIIPEGDGWSVAFTGAHSAPTTEDEAIQNALALARRVGIQQVSAYDRNGNLSDIMNVVPPPKE